MRWLGLGELWCFLARLAERGSEAATAGLVTLTVDANEERLAGDLDGADDQFTDN